MISQMFKMFRNRSEIKYPNSSGNTRNLAVHVTVANGC